MREDKFCKINKKHVLPCMGWDSSYLGEHYRVSRHLYKFSQLPALSWLYRFMLKANQWSVVFQTNLVNWPIPGLWFFSGARWMP
jgi:hypothetical protein